MGKFVFESGEDSCMVIPLMRSHVFNFHGLWWAVFFFTPRYLYAQVFAGDLWKALFEKKSLERASGDALWHGLLQHGGARDPHRMLRELLGRPPCVESFAAAIASRS